MSTPNTWQVFAIAGFQVRGKRATCPHCEGSRALTVAITDEGLWFCHRCHRGGSARQLAREQGTSLLAPRKRRPDAPKREFFKWLAQKRHEMAEEEHALAYRVDSRYTRAEWRRDPDSEIVWDGLAHYYERKPVFDQFWISASDKIGRFWLYRLWRRQHRAQ